MIIIICLHYIPIPDQINVKQTISPLFAKKAEKKLTEKCRKKDRKESRFNFLFLQKDHFTNFTDFFSNFMNF